MKYEKRFEAREVKASNLGARVEGDIWRVYDFKTKSWWRNSRNNNLNVADALMIADALNNGKIRP